MIPSQQVICSRGSRLLLRKRPTFSNFLCCQQERDPFYVHSADNNTAPTGNTTRSFSLRSHRQKHQHPRNHFLPNADLRQFSIFGKKPPQQSDNDRKELQQQHLDHNSEQPCLLSKEDEEEDYEHLIHIAQKRNVQVTVQKGTKAGIITGLLVMGGVIIAGPVGAVVGGAIGTGLAATVISRKVVSVQSLLQETPRAQRREVYRVFSEAIQAEFRQGFQSNPDLHYLLSKKKGMVTMSVLKYCLDRKMMDREKLQKLDGILTKKIK